MGWSTVFAILANCEIKDSTYHITFHDMLSCSNVWLISKEKVVERLVGQNIYNR